ncbi:MAG: site-specific DNA-methyltransferase [Propionibacteriaceae bacterium]|nr:site-specific DNA-methyltransferase [Propionibacteriaceae bacterium]
MCLLAPAANRVYADQAPRLAAAEWAITTGTAAAEASIAGVPYLHAAASELDLAAVGRLSACLALFQAGPPAGSGPLAAGRPEPTLVPVALPDPRQGDDDLVTIPKYAGKTNEQFTRLLLNVTLSQVTAPGPATVLDPLCGRGTTLLSAWLRGLDAAGVEADVKAVEALAAYLKTYLRRKRLKHSAAVSPVRREGRSLGKRLDVEAALPGGTRQLTVFTGDTRRSAALFGKKRFAAIVTDAPYGIVHGARDGRNAASRDRSAAQLLREAIPVWASQLAPGGALGLSWNTLTLPRAGLAEILAYAGLELRDDGPWRDLAHRVDSSVVRDVAVAVRPAQT